MNMYQKEKVENVRIEYYQGKYHLKDHDTGRVAYGRNLNKVFSDLLQKNRDYLEDPGKVEKEEAERAADLIRDMIKHERILVTLMVGLISSDNNRSKSEIEKNLDHLRWLQKGMNLVEYGKRSEKEEERFQTLKRYISEGIEILERDESLVPAERMVEQILGEHYYATVQMINEEQEKGKRR